MKNAVLILCLTAPLWGQKLVQRGYVETRLDPVRFVPLVAGVE